MSADEQDATIAELMAAVAGQKETPAGAADALPAFLASAAAGSAEQINGLAGQLDQLRQASQQQAEVLAANTQAVAQNTASQGASGGNSVASTAGKILSTVFGSGLGVSPLISGLVKLFGGGGTEAAPLPLEKYVPPARVEFTGGFSMSGDTRIYGLDYARGDQPRLVGSPPDMPPLRAAEQNLAAMAASLDVYRPSPEGVATAFPVRDSQPDRQPPAQQVTIQVQAFDSRSFLDHSEEIARAVREAMLNSHGINDVVAEL